MSNIIVRHCAPTLAGMKTANMFTIKYSNFLNLLKAVKRTAGKLKAKGVSVCILKTTNGKALIYLYRDKLLQERLSTERAMKILKDFGYPYASIEELSSGECSQVIAYLKERISTCESFPHEVGLFLGYPIGDVEGFIKNHGRNSLSCGHWKVYCNLKSAQCTFEK